MASITQIQPLLLAFLAVWLTSTLNPAGATATLGLYYQSKGQCSVLEPEEVVMLYKKHGFGAMRMHEPDPDMLAALRKSGLQVILGVPNRDLAPLAMSTSAASSWIMANVLAYWPDVQFKYIAVGNQALSHSPASVLLGAMKNLQQALSSAGLDAQIHVSTCVDVATALNTWTLPSEAAFLDSWKAMIQPLAEILAKTNAPILANVFPYQTYVKNTLNLPLSYALFTAKTSLVKDGQLEYQNLFDAMVDALTIALEKIGAPNMRIVIDETGWPSAAVGDMAAAPAAATAATPASAQMYVSNLISHVLAGRGTPRKPGVQVDTFLFTAMAGVKKGYGLFYPDGNAVYKLPVA